MATKSTDREGAEALVSLLSGDDGDTRLAKRFVKLPKDKQQRLLSRMKLAGQYDPAMQINLDLVGIISLIKSLV